MSRRPGQSSTVQCTIGETTQPCQKKTESRSEKCPSNRISAVHGERGTAKSVWRRILIYHVNSVASAMGEDRTNNSREFSSSREIPQLPLKFPQLSPLAPFAVQCSAIGEQNCTALGGAHPECSVPTMVVAGLSHTRVSQGQG